MIWDRPIPCYHDVPIQVDYSDLYDTFAFFFGTLNELPGRGDILPKISVLKPTGLVSNSGDQKIYELI
ncbi:hypothetical protein V565_242480 [Rhizoctonia solani 123E]|uniref:Uncharacterized protein n=1 Tax=Rhizoctonia solani 123E TaxID=1423351 RepID=A0A074RGA7_9AGAM|nr:hypothetical protein V565_242480 [Rhizoctonia solani 123E]